MQHTVGRIEELRKSKMNTNDRVFKLEAIEGKKMKNVIGVTDNRLFTGDNTLHAIREPDGIWHLKYEKGILPEPFKQKFTGFNKLFRFVEDYYSRRNIKVKEAVNS